MLALLDPSREGEDEFEEPGLEISMLMEDILSLDPCFLFATYRSLEVRRGRRPPRPARGLRRRSMWDDLVKALASRLANGVFDDLSS